MNSIYRGSGNDFENPAFFFSYPLVVLFLGKNFKILMAKEIEQAMIKSDKTKTTRERIEREKTSEQMVGRRV